MTDRLMNRTVECHKVHRELIMRQDKDSHTKQLVKLDSYRRYLEHWKFGECRVPWGQTPIQGEILRQMMPPSSFVVYKPSSFIFVQVQSAPAMKLCLLLTTLAMCCSAANYKRVSIATLVNSPKFDKLLSYQQKMIIAKLRRQMVQKQLQCAIHRLC